MPGCEDLATVLAGEGPRRRVQRLVAVQLLGLLKRFGQDVQGKGRSPVWMRRCSCGRGGTVRRRGSLCRPHLPRETPPSYPKAPGRCQMEVHIPYV